MLRTSSTELAEPLPLLMNMVSNIEISNGGDNKTIKRLPPHAKSTIKSTSYLTFNVKVTFT